MADNVEALPLSHYNSVDQTFREFAAGHKIAGDDSTEVNGTISGDAIPVLVYLSGPMPFRTTIDHLGFMVDEASVVPAMETLTLQWYKLTAVGLQTVAALVADPENGGTAVALAQNLVAATPFAINYADTANFGTAERTLAVGDRLAAVVVPQSTFQVKGLGLVVMGRSDP